MIHWMTTLYCSSSSSDEEDEFYKDVELRKEIHQLERALHNVDSEAEHSKRRLVSVSHLSIYKAVCVSLSVYFHPP